MAFLALFISAVAGYLISGLNPAIIMSQAIYKRDIRNEGSGNPGFTNFKRVFGNKYAWFVFFLDLFKGAVISVIAGLLFKAAFDNWSLGVAYAGMFAMLGHAFPIYYGFKGGKGFLVALSTIFFIDWRAGLVAFAVMAVLLLTVKYMSLATNVGLLCGLFTAAIAGRDLATCIMYALCVFFVIARHHENIDRLINGTESKFSFGSHKEG